MLDWNDVKCIYEDNVFDKKIFSYEVLTYL